MSSLLTEFGAEHFRDFPCFLNFPIKCDIRCQFSGGILQARTGSLSVVRVTKDWFHKNCSSALPRTGTVSWSKCLHYLDGLCCFPLGLFSEISCYFLSNIRIALHDKSGCGIEELLHRDFLLLEFAPSVTLPHLRAKDVLGRALNFHFPELHWQVISQNRNPCVILYCKSVRFNCREKNCVF